MAHLKICNYRTWKVISFPLFPSLRDDEGGRRHSQPPFFFWHRNWSCEPISLFHEWIFKSQHQADYVGKQKIKTLQQHPKVSIPGDSIPSNFGSEHLHAFIFSGPIKMLFFHRLHSRMVFTLKESWNKLTEATFVCNYLCSAMEGNFQQKAMFKQIQSTPRPEMGYATEGGMLSCCPGLGLLTGSLPSQRGALG